MKPDVMKWSRPLFEAFIAGAWFLYWTEDTLYWIAKPTLVMDDGRRLHCENGPAVLSDVEPLYFWRGVLVEREWIEDRPSLTAPIALQQSNLEVRRAACEILGWSKIIRELNGTIINRDDDPEIGELVRVELPDSGHQNFLRVLCATRREFAIPVPIDMKTALQANAWTFGIDDFINYKPEVRT